MKIRSTSELHKYMSAERAIGFLKDRTIRFTQPNALNDPYECHLTINRKVRETLLEDSARYRKTISNLSEDEIREQTAANESTIIENALLAYRRIRNELGVLSLTEDPLNLLMWAHYGDEHKGIVVELDFAHPSLFIGSSGGKEFASLYAVRYTREKVCGIPTPENVIETLITKSPEWGYEKEWRFVRTLNLLRESKPNIFVADIAPEAIKRIILGARFPAEKLPEITECLKDDLKHVIVEKAVMIPNKFGLRLVDAERFGWILLHRGHHFGEVAKEALLCLTMDDDEDVCRES